MAKINTAYKYRIYPTEEQRTLFAKTFGCCRKVYNLMLADKKEHYCRTGKMLTVTPAKYKDEYPYLKEVDSLALANEQMNLQAAYRCFFRDRRTGFLKFKSKKHDKDSYTTNRVNGNISVTQGAIRLPKAGTVKAKTHRLAPTGYVLKSVTITREKDGTYYASVLYEYELEARPSSAVTHTGLAYKSDGLFVDASGWCADMPHFYRHSQRRLAREQRKLSKMTKGSSNYSRQKRRVAKISRHTACQRRDYLHKLSAGMTNRYDLISVENLNMRGMAGSLHLGTTMDNGYGMFLAMLEYKQERKGHYFIKVDRHYPSSQLCACGFQNPATKDLSVRTVTCPKCGRVYDRDQNAAANIDKEGFRILHERIAA